MPTPRLIEVRCPQCGAGMHIDPTSLVVDCQYCKLSSFVHLPDRPAPPPPADGEYGHIHVSAGAPRAAGRMVVVLIAVVCGVAGLLAVVLVSVSPPPAVVLPAGRTTEHGTTSSDACAKAVACCKATMTSAGNDPSSQRA